MEAAAAASAGGGAGGPRPPGGRSGGASASGGMEAARRPLPVPLPVLLLPLLAAALGAAGRGGPGPVTCGSVVKLLNVRHNVRLHSHDVRYGSGNGRAPPPRFPRFFHRAERGVMVVLPPPQAAGSSR